MGYTKFNNTWFSFPSTLTIVGKAGLEHIEQGIFDAAADADTALARVMPSGGAAFTFLKKNSATSYDAGWATLGATDIPTLTSAKISDFTEASQDVIGAMVTAAGGTYNDAAGTITLPGGGSGVPSTSFSATATWRAPRPQSNGNSGIPADGSLMLWPLIIPRALTLTGLATRVAVAGTASTLRVCIYNDDGSFFPSTLVKATSALASTSTGALGETFSSVSLPAGLYWIGALYNGTTTAALEAAASGGNSAPMEDWSVMPHGTGALPSVNAGNDGSVAMQTGQSTAPSTFAGTLQTDKNSPKIPMWVCLKVNR